MSSPTEDEGHWRPPKTVKEFMEYEFQADPYGVFPRMPLKEITLNGVPIQFIAPWDSEVEPDGRRDRQGDTANSEHADAVDEE